MLPSISLENNLQFSYQHHHNNEILARFEPRTFVVRSAAQSNAGSWSGNGEHLSKLLQAYLERCQQSLSVGKVQIATTQASDQQRGRA
jgi:hypothetical protein